MMNFFQESKALLSNTAGTPYPPEWKDYIRAREEIYSRLIPDYVQPNMRSEAMWVLRSRCHTGADVGVHVERGDICWMDYGQTFLNEMGYQHFGLVLSLCNKKALIAPLTSNRQAYERAGMTNRMENHLFRIGQPEGLNRPSTLFLNDLRFVNTARILYVRAHIDPESSMFQEIQTRVIEILTGSGIEKV